MQQKGVALRKRTQIAIAKRIMFVWVAGISVILGFAIVGSMFLIQMLVFKEKVISAENTTISRLQKNIANIKNLESEVRVLDTNSNLASIKASPTDNALQVILDALPSEANSLALGASIQNKLLNIPGLEIISLQVDPVAGIEALSSDGSSFQVASSSQSSVSNYEITFRFSIQGSETVIKQVLLNLEKSIRTIDIVTMKIEGQNTLTVQGRAFYEPEVLLKLVDKGIK